MKAFRALLKTELLVFYRDRLTLFFTVLFPLVFILIFGFLMGDMGGQRAKLGLRFEEGVDRSTLQGVLSEMDFDKIVDYPTAEELESAVAQRKVDFGLVWNGKELLFIYHPGRVQENHAFQQMAQGISAQFNLRYQELASVLRAEKVHVGTIAALNWFNVTVPGIIAFSILSAGLFAVSGHITAMKERKMLDRMVVTPMPALALLGAVIAVRLVVVYLSTLITLLVSIVLFKLSFSVDWFHYTVVVLCSTVGMMGVGTLIALLVRRPSSASNVANVLSMIMLFLSGVYFPIELMPGLLRAVSRALPLTYMAETMRFATGVADMSTRRFWGVNVSLLCLAALLLPLLGRYVVRAQRR